LNPVGVVCGGRRGVGRFYPHQPRPDISTAYLKALASAICLASFASLLLAVRVLLGLSFLFAQEQET